MNMAHTTMIDGWEGRTPGATACGVSPSRTRRPDRHSRIPPPDTTCPSGNPTLSGITGQVAL